MFLRKKFDKHTGIYRSSDPIQNFQFKVTLKKLNSLIKVPRLMHTTTTTNNTTSGQAERNVGNDDDDDDDDATDELETLTVQWLQKRFSRKEIDFYNDQANCKTDIHKEYHRIIKINDLPLLPPHDDDNERRRRSDRVFTYVPDDCYSPPADDDEEFTTHYLGGGGDAPTTKKMLNLNAVTKKKSNENSSAETINKTMEDNFETMYVMADLVASIETVLFVIRWNVQEKVLFIYPDFNRIKETPYLKEINVDSRHQYLYAIENMSTVQLTVDEEPPSTEDWHLNRKLETISNKMTDLALSTSSTFTMPPRRCTNVYLFAEIVSVDHFEFDNIHVRYRWILPARVEVIGDAVLVGSTHSSRKSKEDGSWRIGFCHELAVRCLDDYRPEDHMKIMYELISIDGWQRERSEGYAMQIVPFQAGKTSGRLPCYRNVSSSETIINRLERYFIGGRHTFHANAFHGISGGGDSEKTSSSKLNRYGNCTKTTGILRVTNRCVLQRDVSFCNSSTDRRHRNSSTMGLETTDKQKTITIDDVVLAYQMAKQRLEAATLAMR